MAFYQAEKINARKIVFSVKSGASRKAVLPRWLALVFSQNPEGKPTLRVLAEATEYASAFGGPADMTEEAGERASAQKLNRRGVAKILQSIT